MDCAESGSFHSGHQALLKHSVHAGLLSHLVKVEMPGLVGGEFGSFSQALEAEDAAGR